MRKPFTVAAVPVAIVASIALLVVLSGGQGSGARSGTNTITQGTAWAGDGYVSPAQRVRETVRLDEGRKSETRVANDSFHGLDGSASSATSNSKAHPSLETEPSQEATTSPSDSLNGASETSNGTSDRPAEEVEVSGKADESSDDKSSNAGSPSDSDWPLTPSQADEVVLDLARKLWNGVWLARIVGSREVYQRPEVAKAAWRLLDRLVQARLGHGMPVENIGLGSNVAHNLLWIASFMPEEHLETTVVEPLVHQTGMSRGAIANVYTSRLSTILKLPDHVSPALALGLADTIRAGALAKYIELAGNCPPRVLNCLRALAMDATEQGASRRLAAEPWIMAVVEWIDARSVNEARNPSELPSGYQTGFVQLLEACFPNGLLKNEEVLVLDDESGASENSYTDDDREQFSDHIQIAGQSLWSKRLAPSLALLHGELLKSRFGEGGGGGLRYFRSPKVVAPEKRDVVFTDVATLLGEFHARVSVHMQTMSRVDALNQARTELHHDLGKLALEVDVLKEIANRALMSCVTRTPGSLEADCDVWFIDAARLTNSARKFKGDDDPRRKLIQLSGPDLPTKFATIVRALWREEASYRGVFLDCLRLILEAEGKPSALLGATHLALLGIDSASFDSELVDRVMNHVSAELERLAPRRSESRRMKEYGDIMAWMASAVSLVSIPVEGSHDEEEKKQQEKLVRDTLDALNLLAQLSSGADPANFRGLRSEELWLKMIRAIGAHDGGAIWPRSTRLKLLYAGWDV